MPMAVRGAAWQGGEVTTPASASAAGDEFHARRQERAEAAMSGRVPGRAGGKHTAVRMQLGLGAHGR